jgi:hypothetical protein
VLPGVAMTATRLRINSSAKSGKRFTSPMAKRYSNVTLWPSMYPASASPPAKKANYWEAHVAG